MTIVRSIKDRNNPYVQINKTVFDDPLISLKAKGFIGYCLSKPDSWLFHVEQLSKVLKEKETSIRNVIKECIDHGYAIRWRMRAGSGMFQSWQTIISDSKEEILRVKKELNSDLRVQSSFSLELKENVPHRGFPQLDNRALVIKDNSNNNPPLSSPQKKPAPKTPPVKEHAPTKKELSERISLRSEEEDFYLNNLFNETTLSPKERERLIKSDYSKEQITAALEKIKTQNVKKTFMGLLLQILGNPDKWESKTENRTTEELKALQYNNLLAKVRPTLAKENESLIATGGINVLHYGQVQRISLKAFDFIKDITEAIKQLNTN